MALDDRDYMRDRIRKRDGYTEKSDMRRSMAGERHWYNPKLFRGSRNVGQQTDPAAGGNWWRALVFFLAIYGTVTLLRDVTVWAEKRKQVHAAQLQAQTRESKEAAWARFYQQPEYCNYAKDQAWQHCLSERSQARLQFESLYAAGKLK